YARARSASRGALPVLRDVPARGDDAPEGEHRRVRREDDELLARRCELEPAVERPFEIRQELDAAPGETAVLRAPCKPPGARRGGAEPLEPVEERLEVDIPDPRDVATVGDLVVEPDDEPGRRAPVDERPDRLVRPRRVLDQQHQQPTVA